MKVHAHTDTHQKMLHSKDGSVKFALDGGSLLVQIGGDYPCPIDAVATLALANLLHIHYDEIVEEARKHQHYSREAGTNATRA
jgi:hypothetical protein